MKNLHRCALIGFFLGVAPLAADGPWAPAVFLDPGTVLELTPSAGTQTGNTIFVGTLFDEAANSLELGRVNVSTLPPTATFVPIETGSIFALGGIDQAAGFVGFSYINPSFDLKFARCAAPCNSVPAVTIDSATNWIDSSSAASADDFFVAGLDDGTDSIKIHYSDDGGATWHLLNTLTPPSARLPHEVSMKRSNWFNGLGISLSTATSNTGLAPLRQLRRSVVVPAVGRVSYRRQLEVVAGLVASGSTTRPMRLPPLTLT